MSDTTPLALPSVEKIGQTMTRRGSKFWLIFLSICTSLFLSAFDLTGLSTALPTIINDLHGADYVWVGSGYALASTAVLPLCGGLAEIFGRRVAMIGTLLLFAIGSALCGSAQNMTWLVAARVVQGLGAGGLQSIPNIIVSDLVPLSERGTYQGFIGLTWAFASAIAPLVSGALASNGQWRWFFYLNLPLCGIALVLILLFLHLPTPPGTLQEKLNRIDWIGNMIFVASTTTLVIGLTWGGITYPWVSVHVLAPLLLGTCGLGLFMFYEAKFATNPIVPISLLRNRTSVSGYIQTFINPVVNIAILYYIPVYYQACKDASPIGSSVDMLTLSLVLAPCAVLGGVSVAKFQRFRPQLWIAWCLYIIGMGAFTVVRADTAKAVSIGLNVIIAVGGGILLSVVYFPILSPLSVSENAAALSFHGFCRLFAGVWGVSIGAAILQNQLASRLPPQFLETVLNGSSYDSSNVNLVFSVIPLIHTLPEPLKEEVRAAFGDSLAVVWQVMTGILVIGLIASVLMRDVPLHSNVDKKWGVRELEKDGGGKDAERQGEGSDNSVKTESITSLVV